MKKKHEQTRDNTLPTSAKQTQPRDTRDTRDTRPKEMDWERLGARIGKLMGKGTPLPLPREEWDFLKAPKGELNACLDYELCRELKGLGEAMKKWRSEHDAVGRVLFDWNGRSVRPNDWPSESDLRSPFQGREWLLLFPEFPVSPWQSVLPAPERAKRVAYMKRAGFSFSADRGVHLLMEMDIQNLLNEHGVFQDWLDIPHNEWPQSFAIFRIDWGLPNKQLLGAFERWLDERRPGKGGKIHNQPKRGGAADRLKQLGAYRLLRHYGQNWILAEDASEGILGKPLYSGQSAWITARKEAQNDIAALLSKKVF